MNNPSTSRAQSPSAASPFEINRRVLASDLTLAAKAVLIVILDHARYGASTCTASTRTIAREANVTERHVRRVMPDLEARRLIVVARATGSAHSRHTIAVGPCIHQVGRSVPLRLHEVGHQDREVGHSKPHEVGHQDRQRTNEKGDTEDGSSLDIPEEERMPEWVRRHHFPWLAP